MPTPEELEREVRRRPIGRTIIAICLDLAVMPGLCTGPFWNELLEIIQCLRGCLGTLMKEKMRRERAIALEQDRIPGSDWKWMHLKRDDIRQVLGFLIGETPVDPFAPRGSGHRPALTIQGVKQPPPPKPLPRASGGRLALARLTPHPWGDPASSCAQQRKLSTRRSPRSKATEKASARFAQSALKLPRCPPRLYLTP
jgi:hypothetical protein